MATHALTKTEPHARCAYDDIRRIAFSRGGKLIFTLMRCGFDHDTGQLEWTAP